ncbi:MAG: molybdate transport system permease protein [bacterium]|nr:MAG: molybdate transport system permease protein [bacterium]
MLNEFWQIDWFPIRLTLQVATLATLISLFIGIFIGYLLARKNIPGRDLVDSLISLPLVLPPTVLGYYLLILLGARSPIGKLWENIFGSPLVFTWSGAVVAATIHSLPLMIKSARVAIEEVPPEIENAARTLGASSRKVFFYITLPLAKRGLLAATMLTFARSLGDFGATIMVAGNIPGRTQTVAIAIYDAVQAGRDNQAFILVVVISLLAFFLLYIVNLLGLAKKSNF